MAQPPGQGASGDLTGWRSEPPPGGWDRAPAAASAAGNRKLLIGSGVVAILAGLGAILVPALASVGTAVVIGCGLLVAGVGLAVGAIAGGLPGHRLLHGVVAIVTLAAGIYLLAAPLDGTFTLTVMLVIWFVLVGVARIVAGIIQLGEPGAGLTVLGGGISLLLGLFIGVELPSSADWAIGLLVGIDFLVYGVLALGRAWLPADR